MITLADAANTEVTIAEAAALFNDCYYTHPSDVIEAWSPAKLYYDECPPNLVGCEHCGHMVRLS